MMKFEKLLAFIAIGSMALATACGGGSSSGTTTSTGGGSTGGGSTTNNVATLTVDAGPDGNEQNLAFVTINVCVPGTGTCQSIDHVQVDTGSSGLRLPIDVPNISLPAQTSGGNPVDECVGFGDGSFIWGPVATADIQIAGEVAHSVPIQIASTAVAPAAASNAGCPQDQTNQLAFTTDFGAKGILGVGLFRQDCGEGCAVTASNDVYFACPAAGCNPIAQSLTAQLQNPVWMFATDNNGVLIQLPSVSASGQGTTTGSLVFGIGTQSDNAVGSATAIQPDTNTGNFGAQFNNVTYNDCQFQGCVPGQGEGSSFIDSGSNGIFFLDSQTLVNSGLAIPDCTNDQSFYCPLSTQTINVGLFNENSSTGTVVGSPRATQFNVADADNLLLQGITATNDLGGQSPLSFDFGMPFFFGKTIFFGIEGQTTPLGTGPLYAF